MNENQLEALAKQLYPHLRGIARRDEELTASARLLYPYFKAEFNEEIGSGVVGGALALFKRALWLLGAGILALLALKSGKT